MLNFYNKITLQPMKKFNRREIPFGIRKSSSTAAAKEVENLGAEGGEEDD